MQGLDPLAAFVGPLETLGVPYRVTGPVAASICGKPRLTADCRRRGPASSDDGSRDR
jgi:hypothetical protein